jgi:hypothetical protein
MKTYKEIETGVIEWREIEGESTTIGLVIEGQDRTRTNDEGEQETYSPWDELIDSGESIIRLTKAEKDKAKAEKDKANKKSEDRKLKQQGVKVFDVMCSATSEDQSGLLAVQAWLSSGGAPTVFRFANGNELELTADNYQEFAAIWMPFRQSFFK